MLLRRKDKPSNLERLKRKLKAATDPKVIEKLEKAIARLEKVTQ